ncbi:UDP-3-O-acyl-N-acetylglucosamine deacetylase [Candidatus Synechococcus calcipolaris G9]|uniref:UDP-3-O-acyl-N-acetylglucosamine deacetylase n=1 Tax=Candidatus Synechococcus calcipolaris G9 TaxID=1497997 RepID=A0ABT6EXC6_9SYNE|nr:UDP-3-O-acyl-N-acetylglucosamine deacetylase [Candidatus Synechococcus calcipolaris]MDG2990462.1 UDP-3-O-acyl-N-acetylglucosamine deacetylase [Candidatus Synechococcus calcipolaris G9]
MGVQDVQVLSQRSPILSDRQHTLVRSLSWSGIGLHSGLDVKVCLEPAPVDYGRVFVRVDLPDRPGIKAQVQQVRSSQLSTELIASDVSIRTVEHLLAALAIAGVDNVIIQITGPEVPLLDGSAQAWLGPILESGVILQDSPRNQRILSEAITIHAGEAFVAAFPSPRTRLSYGIEFDYAVIGQQWRTVELSDLSHEIAPARTFGFAEQVEQLRSAGLIQGGSLENALVCSHEGWLNPPLRFADEPVRHKILDFWGDLSLLGVPPVAHYVAFKASHHLHTQLAIAIEHHLG